MSSQRSQGKHGTKRGYGGNTHFYIHVLSCVFFGDENQDCGYVLLVRQRQAPFDIGGSRSTNAKMTQETSKKLDEVLIWMPSFRQRSVISCLEGTLSCKLWSIHLCHSSSRQAVAVSAVCIFRCAWCKMAILKTMIYSRQFQTPLSFVIVFGNIRIQIHRREAGILGEIGAQALE